MSEIGKQIAARLGVVARFGDVGSDDNRIRYLLGEAESAIAHVGSGGGRKIAAELVERAESLVQAKTPAELRNRIKRIKAMMSPSGAKSRMGLEQACWEGYEAVGTKKKDGKTVPNCVPKDKNAVREGAKVSAGEDAVSRKIALLMREGYPQDEAVAIALDMERRGEL